MSSGGLARVWAETNLWPSMKQLTALRSVQIRAKARPGRRCRGRGETEVDVVVGGLRACSCRDLELEKVLAAPLELEN